MKISEKQIFIIVLSFSLFIVALSVSYYFLWFLPSENKKVNEIEIALKKQELEMKEKEQQEKVAKEAEQTKAQQAQLAEEIRDKCERTAKEIANNFSVSSAKSSPMFYPYEGAQYFSLNADLTTGLSAFISCIEDSPKNSDNKNIDEIIREAKIGSRIIELFMAKQKRDNPAICSSYLLGERAKSKCKDMDYDQSIRNYAFTLVSVGDFEDFDTAKGYVEFTEKLQESEL